MSDEIDEWFTRYFNAFIDISAGRSPSEEILRYWSVPLHTSSPAQSRWLHTGEDVIRVLSEMQRTLKDLGYTHTEAIDKRITVYSDRASRVETIMSRRRADDVEVDRAAISFELRRADSWIIISTTARPTHAATLDDVW